MTTDTRAVARWGYDGCMDVVECPDGEYVLLTDHDRMVAELRAALAATGKQQIDGPGGWSFKVIDGNWAVSNPCCGLSSFLHAPGLHTWSCEQSMKPVSASPQQVGEVQGSND